MNKNVRIGLFRLWVVASVAWAGYCVLSDPASSCLIATLIKPVWPAGTPTCRFVKFIGWTSEPAPWRTSEPIAPSTGLFSDLIPGGRQQSAPATKPNAPSTELDEHYAVALVTKMIGVPVLVACGFVAFMWAFMWVVAGFRDDDRPSATQ
jgi:hypothetical protein